MVESATLVVKNGRIYTVDRDRSWAQAIAVEGDRIVRVGTNEEIEEMSGPDTVVIDAGDRLVLPGFNDSHTHTSLAFEMAFSAQLGEAESLEEISALVRKHGEAHPEYRLVRGAGWVHDAVLVDRRYPKKEDIDEIISERPVLLVSFDGWVGLGNSMFTEIAEEAVKGIAPNLGEMERDSETGEATGVFLNPADLTFLAGDLSALMRESELDGLRWIFRQMPRYGITSIHDALSDSKSFEAYEKLRSAGELLARAYISLVYHKLTTEADLAGFVDIRKKHSDEWIRAGVVKLFLDGVLDSHTAAMIEPYADDPSSRGDTKFSPKKFKAIVEKLDKMGFQCMTHSSGDGAVRLALDAYEDAANSNGRRDSRHRIEHIEMLSQEDVPRFGELGVIASMQPMHAEPDSDCGYARAAGPERMKTSCPWRALDETGAVLAFSSDWYVVDLNPLLGIHAAVTRNWSADSPRSVSLEKAIEAYTLNGAYASFEENTKGSIEVGKLADFVVLSDNLFEMPPEEIADAKVLLTVLGGKKVYGAEGFSG